MDSPSNSMELQKGLSAFSKRRHSQSSKLLQRHAHAVLPSLTLGSKPRQRQHKLPKFKGREKGGEPRRKAGEKNREPRRKTAVLAVIRAATELRLRVPQWLTRLTSGAETRSDWKSPAASDRSEPKKTLGLSAKVIRKLLALQARRSMATASQDWRHARNTTPAVGPADGTPRT